MRLVAIGPGIVALANALVRDDIPINTAALA